MMKPMISEVDDALINCKNMRQNKGPTVGPEFIEPLSPEELALWEVK